MTSKVTGSMISLFIGKLYDNIESFIYSHSSTRADNQSRLALFNDCGVVELQLRLQNITIINRYIDIPPHFREVSPAGALARIPTAGSSMNQLQLQLQSRSTYNDTPVDHLQKHIRTYFPEMEQYIDIPI